MREFPAGIGTEAVKSERETEPRGLVKTDLDSPIDQQDRSMT